MLTEAFPAVLKPVPELHLHISKGGLGDSVARMPAVNYILKNHKHIQKVRLFIQDYFIEVAKHLINESPERFEVYGLQDVSKILTEFPDRPGMKVDSLHHTTMRAHLTDHAFHTLVDVQPTAEMRNYLKIRPNEIEMPANLELPAKPYVVVTTGFTAAVREMLPAYINDITFFLRERGYAVVFLGQKQSYFWKGGKPTEANFREEVEYRIGYDLRDKTTPLQAAKIMGQARAVVGLDNGLLHLAATTDVPIVAGYTSVAPEHRLPYRRNQLGWNVKTVVPEREKVACRFCQTKMNYVYEFDFRTCFFGHYQCILNLSSQAYIEALKQVLHA